MRNFGLAALFVLVSNSVWAQATGTFDGRVTDESGLAIPGATVTATNTATGVTRTTVTNDSGLYSLPALQPSVYDINVELAGFAPASRRAVTLTTDTALTIDFTLRVAAVAETLTVTGQAPLVETSRSDVSGSIQLSELQSLPMLDRNFTGLVALLPGARPAPTYNTTKRLSRALQHHKQGELCQQLPGHGDQPAVPAADRIPRRPAAGAPAPNRRTIELLRSV